MCILLVDLIVSLELKLHVLLDYANMPSEDDEDYSIDDQIVINQVLKNEKIELHV